MFRGKEEEKEEKEEEEEVTILRQWEVLKRRLGNFMD